MDTQQQPRKRIADIIRDSGKMGTDQGSGSQGDLSAAFSALTATPAGVLTISEALGDDLAKRFKRLSAAETIERDLSAPYEVAGRSVILALQACGYTLSAAFDTASGAMIEATKAISLLAPRFTLSLAMIDRDTATHLVGHVEHIGIDWGQNKKILNELFAKADDYLRLFGQ